MEKKTWKEFKDCKLLWWVNRTIHIFGWAIVVAEDDQGEIVDVYPARVPFRGFDYDAEELGFEGLSCHIKDQIDNLVAETKIVR